MLQYLEYNEKILIVLSEKHFKNICFTLSSKIMIRYIKFHFKQNLCGEKISICNKPFSFLS